MNKKLLLLAAGIGLAVTMNAQTLYVPSGTSGIGTSTNGNVGIGVPNPLYKLVVQGEIHVNRDYPYIQFNSSYWNAGSFIQTGVTTTSAANGDYMVLYNPASKGFNFRQGSYDALTVVPNGNVGIGTISPAYKLDLNGELSMGSGSVNANTTKIFLRNPGGGKTWAISSGANMITESSFSIYNWTDNQTVPFFHINSSGNVGIGTTNPQNKLDVNGTIHAKEVKVDLTGWSDFVFAPAYKLKTLAEVEQYIKIHNHLPEIPSAKEVEQNGVNVGEMQAKLLQKVEELTLYSIEQEKKLQGQQQLKAMVEEQSKKLQEQGQENAAMQLKLAKQEQEMKELKELVMKKLK